MMCRKLPGLLLLMKQEMLVEWNSLHFRYVEYNYVVYEDVIGLAEVHQTDAPTLTDTLNDTFIRCGMELCLCRGQAYDKASNMPGHVS